MIEKRPELIKATLFPNRLKHFVGENSCGFDPLHRDSFVNLRVDSLRDGNVCLSVVIPETMTRGFVTFLESMLGLMKTADRQATAAARASRPVDLAELQQAKDYRDNFTDLVCKTFESLIGQGIDKKEAIKETNALLKAKKHPWANHETVRSILSAEGKLRTVRKRPQGNKRSL
jgi:hypothetical protein